MKTVGSDEFYKMSNFIRQCGVVVNTNTLARGHQGFFTNKRIDISAVLSAERKKEVLVHEFAHFIHSRLEPDVIRSHGSLCKLFDTNDIKIIQHELCELTRALDKSASLSRLEEQRNLRMEKIKELAKKIKQTYPEFKRSYPFKKFENILKKSDARYLLKYDRVKIRTPFLRRLKIYSVETFRTDFPHLDENIENYVLLKSHQRVVNRISSRLSRLNKYYSRPSELFARFVESLYKDKDFTIQTAPNAYKRFDELLASGYYFELSDFISDFFLKQPAQCVL